MVSFPRISTEDKDYRLLLRDLVLIVKWNSLKLRDIRRDRKSWNTARVLEELKRHAQSWATGKADPKPQPQQIKQPQQN